MPRDVWLLTAPRLMPMLAAISASAWNIVGGYAGQVSVGHSMFFGLGAYAPLLVYALWGWPPLAGIPAGVALSIGLAVVIAKSFGRIHWHNLVNFGVLPLTFADPSGYDRLQIGDTILIAAIAEALTAGREIHA